MTGDPWQENAPNQVVLFQLIDMHVFALPAETKRAVDAILAAGWRPPPARISHLEQVSQLPVGAVLRTTTGKLFTAGYGQALAGHGLLGAEVIWQPP